MMMMMATMMMMMMMFKSEGKSGDLVDKGKRQSAKDPSSILCCTSSAGKRCYSLVGRKSQRQLALASRFLLLESAEKEAKLFVLLIFSRKGICIERTDDESDLSLD